MSDYSVKLNDVIYHVKIFIRLLVWHGYHMSKETKGSSDVKNVLEFFSLFGNKRHLFGVSWLKAIMKIHSM